jgi:hypothetical protein
MSDVLWAIDSNYRAIGGVAQLVQAFEVVEGSRKRVAEAAAPVVGLTTLQWFRWSTAS